MIEKLLETIRKRYAFTSDEEELLRSKMGPSTSFQAGAVLVPEGQAITYSSLLVEGLACRSKQTRQGSRQIMEFDIPGDFVDLHSYPLERLDHDISAIAPCRIVKLQHTNITDLIALNPRFARIFWFATMVDASIHREGLVNLGVRVGVARIAHLFCEMFYRYRVVGMTRGTSFDFPVSQANLAEAVGFTTVHTNRLLRSLRAQGLATFHGKVVCIADLEALEELAGFDASYLYLEPRSG
jgi:CRP-like cAMP-binding protein